MSSTKKHANLPGFKVDPDTGKYVPVPVNFAALFSDTRTKRQDQEWSSSRKCNDAHSIQPAKFRKTETGVRKELFKPPLRNYEKAKGTTRDTKSRSSGVRKSLIKSIPSKNVSKMTVVKKPEPNESIHLLTITEELEQREEPTKNQGYPFKSTVTPHIKFATNSKDDVKTPESSESDDNFLRLEQLCKSPMITNESPVSTVCNLFQNNMLLNSNKKNVNNGRASQNEIIAEIRRTIVKNQEINEEASAKIKEVVELQTKHEENIKKMIALIDKLEDGNKDATSRCENEEKENSAIKRRSLRLQNKSPTKNIHRPAGSPVILKSGDLRKSTLTKSLVFKCQKYQIDSPRIQKAIDMYNSTRNVCSALLTPKISRGDLDSPITSNWRSNLSLKVQEQCLLLQDTPVHK